MSDKDIIISASILSSDFKKIAPILIIIGLILVSIVLLIGLVSMLTKWDFNKKYSNNY